MRERKRGRKYHSIVVGCGGGRVGGLDDGEVERDGGISGDGGSSFWEISSARLAGLGDGHSSKCVRTSYAKSALG
jgi:hypothetical protein